MTGTNGAQADLPFEQVFAERTASGNRRQLVSRSDGTEPRRAQMILTWITFGEVMARNKLIRQNCREMIMMLRTAGHTPSSWRLSVDALQSAKRAVGDLITNNMLYGLPYYVDRDAKGFEIRLLAELREPKPRHAAGTLAAEFVNANTR